MKITTINFSRTLFTLTCLALFSMALFSNPVNAELTESDVLRLGLNNPHIKAQLDAQLEKARGELETAGRWENPDIEYSNETMDLPGGSNDETSIWLRQKINFAGVKGLQRKAAAKTFEAQTYQQAMQRRHIQNRLREAFYKTLAAQQTATAIEQLKMRLHSISNKVAQRTARGDASRFDALRIEKELSVVSAKSASATARYTALHNALFASIDAPGDSLSEQSLSGRLLPVADVAIADTFQASRHPQLDAMQSLSQSEELSARAAAREQWPELTLGLGRKEASESGFETEGNNISIGLSIPLFDNGRGEKHRAQSSARELKAEYALLQRKLQAAYDSALHAYQANRDAAIKLEAMTASTRHSLGTLAEASYQAGELDIMQLLDAYRSDLQTTEQSIAAALDARLAYIQLQFLQGE